jgi:hypothetical protein
VGSGITPITFTIQRNAGGCSLTLTKDGFIDQTKDIEQDVNPMYWANFVTFPVLFLAAWNNRVGSAFCC